MIKKRIRSDSGWCSEDSHYLRQPEYEIILELSGEFPVRLLCASMGIRRNSFYHWKKRLCDPALKTEMPADNAAMESVSGWIKSDLFTCLHFGQNKGNFSSTVSIRILILVLLPQRGQHTKIIFLVPIVLFVSVKGID